MSIKLSGNNSPIGREKRFRKEDTMRTLSPDEKMFDLDGIYNRQNDCIWAVNREGANRRGGKKIATNVSKKSDGMISRILRGRCVPCSV